MARAKAVAGETIPRHLWYYWNDPDPPTYVEGMMARTAALNNAWNGTADSWNITVLTAGHSLIISGEIQLPPVTDLSVEHVADWYRLYALAKYGGVWQDAGTIPFHPLDSREGGWVDMTSSAPVQGFMVPKGWPQMENWAFAAPANSPFTAAWLKEYQYALTYGDEAYMAANSTRKYLAMPLHLYGETYLLQHACWSVVRYRDFPDEEIPITSSVYTGNPFHVHQVCEWESECVVNKLFSVDRSFFSNTTFIKLRGAERHFLTDSLTEQVASGSWLAQEILDAVPSNLDRVTLERETVSSAWIVMGVVGIVLSAVLLAALVAYLLHRMLGWSMCFGSAKEAPLASKGS
jgi:hypothetical protein